MKRVTLVSMVVLGVATLACGGGGGSGDGDGVGSRVGSSVGSGSVPDLANPQLRQQIRSQYGQDPTVSGVLSSLDTNALDDEAWGDLGDALLSRDLDLAGDCYVHALTLDPADSEWRSKVTEMRGVSEALAVYKTVTDSGRANDEAWGDYGDMLGELGRRDEACTAWQRAQSMDQADSEWQRKVDGCNSGMDVQLIAGGGGFDGGEGGYNPAEQPIDTDWQGRLDRDPTDVNASFGVAVTTRRPRTQVLEELAQRTNSDELWGDAGDAWLNAGNLENAKRAYRTAHELDPDDSEWLRKVSITNRYASGLEDQIANDVRSRTDFTSDESIGDLGDALANVGRYTEACEQYRAALALDTDDGEWLRKVGRCGTLSELQAQAAGSSDPEVIGGVGYAAASEGDWTTAAASFRRAAELAPTSTEWTVAALAANGIGYRQLMEPAMSQIASNDEALGDLADACVDEGRFDDARRYYQQAAQIDASDGEWREKNMMFQ